jgi:hypothetical protein
MKTKTRVLVFAAALLLPPFGLAGWYAAATFLDGGDRLARILRDAGYTELTPPSRFFGPGKITTVETLRNGSVRLHLACEMNDDALAARWKESVTLDRRLVANISQAFDAMAEASAAKARATGKRVKGIDVSLQDMRILTIPHEGLLNVRGQYLKGNCEEAIIWNLRAGASVCQTEEVLQADIVYRIELEDRLGASEKLELARQAAGSAGIEMRLSQANEVRGEDLYLGVKVGLKHCFRLAGNELNPTLVSL